MVDNTIIMIRIFLTWLLVAVFASTACGQRSDRQISPPIDRDDPAERDDPADRFPNDRRPAAIPRVDGPSTTRQTESMLAARSRFLRLYDRMRRAPNMFGDTMTGETVTADVGFALAVVDLPLAGGNRRVKIAENNKALPVDRFSLAYNHFQNARRIDTFPPFPRPPTGPPISSRPLSIDQYTMGVEKTFFDKCWSVEVRMPFMGDPDTQVLDPFGFVAVDLDGGQVGNLAVALKRLVYQTDTFAASAGLGINTPTGSDVRLHLAGTDFEVLNEAVHLLPFAGFLWVGEGDLFAHGFAQLDIATNGNPVQQTSGFAPGRLGTLTDQNLVYLDVSMGRWLYRDPCAKRFTGLASVLELHYTSTMQDADFVVGPGGDPEFGNLRNRFDILNLTVGLHAEFCETNVRVGGVFPLRDGDDRFFDSEVQVSLNRRF